MKSIDNLQRRPSESNAAREKFSSQNAGDGKILKIIPKVPNYNSSECLIQNFKTIRRINQCLNAERLNASHLKFL